MTSDVISRKDRNSKVPGEWELEENQFSKKKKEKKKKWI
jgi:hypothetical protein